MDDFISRSSAKQFVRSERGAELLKHSSLNAIIVLQLIDELPAANATPVVHGRWIDNGNGTVRCNWCATWFPKTRQSQLLFCGCCGAKMDE